MRGTKITAVALAAALAFSPTLASAQVAVPVVSSAHHSATPWWLFICPVSLVTAASVKNWKRNKQLTNEEAWTCGLLYWYNEATGKYERRR